MGSRTTNPKADLATKTPGGWSGIVDLQPGDVFRFECEVVNETSRTFTGQNEAVDDEMCSTAVASQRSSGAQRELAHGYAGSLRTQG